MLLLKLKQEFKNEMNSTAVGMADSYPYYKQICTKPSLVLTQHTDPSL